MPGRPRHCPTTPTWGLGQMGFVTLKSCNSRTQRGTPSPAWGFQRAGTLQRTCQWPVAPCRCTTTPRCHFCIDKHLQVFGKRRKDMCNPSVLLLHKIFYCMLTVFPAALGIDNFKFFRVIICTVPSPPHLKQLIYKVMARLYSMRSPRSEGKMKTDSKIFIIF